MKTARFSLGNNFASVFLILLLSVAGVLFGNGVVVAQGNNLPDMADKYYASRFIRDCYNQSNAASSKKIIEAGANNVVSLFAAPDYTAVNIGIYFGTQDNKSGKWDGGISCKNNDKNNGNYVASAMSTLQLTGPSMLEALGYKKEDRLITGGQCTIGENNCPPEGYIPEPNLGCDPLNNGSTCYFSLPSFEYKLSGNAKVDEVFNRPYAGLMNKATEYYVYDKILLEACEYSPNPNGAWTIKAVVRDPNDSTKYIVEDMKITFPDKDPLYNNVPSVSERDLRNYNYQASPSNIKCKDLAGKLNDQTLANQLVNFNSDFNNTPYLTGDGKRSIQEDGTPGEAVCAGGAFGWILCPLVTLSEGILNVIAPQIENQLFIPPLLGENTQSAALQEMWRVVVGISNIFLVIIFLIVIFSQATSVGLSAYGIKKMLPRIIAAAILINISYFLCAIAVDISNILGDTVKGLIAKGMGVVSGTATVEDAGAAGLITAFAAWAGIAIAGALLGILGFLVPALVVGVLSLIAMFLMVGLRKVLIILLIILAPLAFAAMVLPGTESMFKKWWSSLFKLLLMYPIIIAIMYGSSLVSMIILTTGGGNYIK